MDFYTNAFQRGDYIYYRGIEKGRRIQRKVPYRPVVYVPSSEESKYKTLDGRNVQPVYPGGIKDTKEFIERYEGVSNYEIFAFTKHEYEYISDLFPDTVEPDLSKIVVVNIDIEVASDDGFPHPDLAEKEITAITMKRGATYYCFGCGDFTPKDNNIKYTKCENEVELILQFLSEWSRLYPDIITGWNITGFDIPYLINRITNVLGEDVAKKLSPWKILKIRDAFDRLGKPIKVHSIMGVANLDYLELYKKYSYTPQESYTLQHVSSKELKTGGKIDYSEYASLHHLYKENFQKFMEYNIRDVGLVDGLNTKGDLIGLAITLSYDNKCNFEDVFKQVRMWDAICYHYLKKRNIVTPLMKEKTKDSSYSGGYVKAPIPGMYKWVISFDLNSLYPHLQMQYTLSPDSLVEDPYSEPFAHLIKQHISVDKILNQELDLSWLKEYGVTITPNKQFFRTNKQGFMAAIMEEMYVGRVKYNDMRKAIKKKAEKEKDPLKKESLMRDFTRYNNLQLAKKVSLNSCYGATGSAFFRYYDIRIAEAVTTAGQLSIRWIQKKMNEYMNRLLKTENVDYIIASDTDSIYLNMEALVNKVFKDTSDVKKVIAFMDKICEEKLQPFIKKSFEELAEYVNAYEQKMEMKRESLCDKAIWTAKKRYILSVHNKEGVEYEEPDISITGLEAIKSSTPSACKVKIKEAIKLIMSKDENTLQEFIKNFRTEFNSLPIEEIAFPRSVNEIEKYTNQRTVRGGLKGPIHVKAAIAYNKTIDKMKLEKNYIKIKSSDKLKFIYVRRPNPYINNNTVAFPVIPPKEFELEKYIDYPLQFEKAFLGPLEIILNAIGWQSEKQQTLESFFN